jgi:hypothetical protein
MFFFRKPQTEVLDHWYTRISGFTTSTQDFYTAIEKELEEQKVPDLAISRVEYSEGGVLSDRRLYLHLARERLTFDICAAPFGTSYFFSCRFGELPAVVKLWQLIMLAVGLGFCGIVSFIIFVRIFGLLAPFLWPVACIVLLLFAIYAMRNAVSMGLKDLDTILLHIPVINAVYEAWFRKETYYRQDTRLMYLDTVNEVVKQHIETITGAKGIKLLRYNQHSPILGELYRPTIVELLGPSKAT